MNKKSNEWSVKTVGKRKPNQGGLEAANNLLKLVIKLRGNKPFIPKGVYRFKSQEELDKWSQKMITR